MSCVFHIFANAALGKGLSGGDRIFIEFARCFSRKYPVTIYVWQEGYLMCQRQNLTAAKNLKFKILKVGFWCNLGFVVCYFARITTSLMEALSIRLRNHPETVVYSASEFWMDSLPCFVLKLRFPKIKWMAAWYQTAPSPWVGYAEGDRINTYKFSAFIYWFVQKAVEPIISKFADFVLVNNEKERKQFPKLDKEGRVVVVLGAIDIDAVKNFQKLYAKHFPLNAKIYDAVFQGRFHPQKGVVELIEIWKLVTQKIPSAKLAMIGDGPLMNDVKFKIKNLALDNNIKLFGYVFDGPKKYEIFSKSKMVVHPAFFDSGGMAAAEAMAFGLPCIGFDLDSYKSYYPKGMVKVKVGDFNKFADMIIKFIENEKEREEVGYEAKKMVLENWSWNQRTNLLIENIENLVVDK